ncbi:winged helix-turn-helix domain-containing protein [Aneurinibacillus tyrosinisolvens]|uniref:winged helix-turn-helix domain-containing protein n=1 Tax=Aneurinibacillus tyrosinisolvens TaxID=1443435 RepID=UPI00063F0EBB|nr:winged helix-turn-helix domain-containing protein [Aneurinibacillus tyrosinisolvens]
MKITFDEDHLSVVYAGDTIKLLPKEFALLQHLFLHEKQIFSRESLLDAVWPLENPTDRTVETTSTAYEKS